MLEGKQFAFTQAGIEQGGEDGVVEPNMSGDLIHQPFKRFVSGSENLLIYTFFDKQVGDLMPPGEESPGSFVATAVDDRDVCSILQSHHRPVSVVVHVNAQRSKDELAQRDVLGLEPFEVIVGVDLLKDQIQPIRDDSLKFVHRVHTTGVTNPSVYLVLTKIDDCCDRRTSEPQFFSKINNILFLIQFVHKNSFTAS
ncbi:hypothetical protein NHH03_25545 [Stieleria sp. TO1_6]|uniref:hypothetical protein n=1 Tax=Stieleria tagensis TaxID=2956795 RepID=UPI00209BB277|nr:hypothetical protein [Stieleria tagensis]MCO8125126.1 hypothetical protein [Stieleria tagensis]